VTVDARKASRPRWPLLVIPLTAIVVSLLPLPLEPRAHAVAVVFSMAVIAWMTEVVPLPVTSLVIPALLSASGAVTVREAFVGFGDPILFIFVGAFFMAAAMHRHGLDRRLAEYLLGAPIFHGRPLLAFAAFLLVAVLMSMWISNTATIAIMLPIFLGARDLEGSQPHERREAGVLTLAYASSVGGMGMLVGSPPNAIATRFLDDALGEQSFGYVDWAMFGLPSALVMASLLYVVFLFRGGRSLRIDAPEASDRGPMSRGEKITLACFLAAVAGWSLPGIAKAAGLPHAAFWNDRLHPGAVALLASLPLFFTGDRDGEPVLPWRDGSKIDWGIIMLFAGGISLGEAMVQTGLAQAMGQALVEGGGIQGVWTLTAVSILFTILFTEICSNTAAANMLVPLVIAAAATLGVSPIPPAVGVGLAASCAFMLPVATGPNAIAYGSGEVTAREMIRYGFLLNIFAVFILTGMLYVLATLLGIA
jgi:solute carrier family 13 (sodium-dependent dicarboxylate transporter), member 2/3/5